MGKKGRSILKKPSRPKPAKGVQKSFDCPLCEDIGAVRIDMRKVNENPKIACSNVQCSLCNNPVTIVYDEGRKPLLDPIDVYTDYKDNLHKANGNILSMKKDDQGKFSNLSHTTTTPSNSSTKPAAYKSSTRTSSSKSSSKSKTSALEDDDILAFD